MMFVADSLFKCHVTVKIALQAYGCANDVAQR